MLWLKTDRQTQLRTALFRLIGYSAAFALLFLLDNAVESIGFKETPSDKYAKIFSPSVLYPYLVGAGSKQGMASHVVVVTIGKDEDEKDIKDDKTTIYRDPCQRRRLIADIISVGVSAKAAAIALDYSFNENGCDEEFKTKLLKRQFQNSSLPIVLGQGTTNFDDLRVENPSEFRDRIKHDFGDRELLIQNPTPFTELNPTKVSVGLMRLDSDVRKIPLSWPVRKGDRVEWMDTLSFSAARSISGKESCLLKRIENLKKGGRHPIGSFFKQEDLPLFTASELVCGTSATLSHWPRCRSRWRKLDPSVLTNKVLVVGLVDPEARLDIHESPIGKVSGLMLQANYIESLLSNSYLKSVSRLAQFIIGILWFVLVEAILHRRRGSIFQTIIFPLLIIGALWTAISVALLFLVGIYVELLFPSILVIIVAHISKRVENVLDPKESAQEGVIHGQSM